MRQFLEAEAGIRQLHAHSADAVWRKDAEAFAACFTADAEWRIAGMVLQGRDEIAAGIGRILANARGVLITYRTPQLRLTDDGAEGRVYVTEQCSWTDRPAFTTIGRYFEHYAEDHGRWRFSWRLFQVLYKGPADLGGTFADAIDYGPWPAMPPRDAVPPAMPVR